MARFELLRWHRRDADQARPLADQLAKTRFGVALALRDLDASGGSTMGWSNGIVKKSQRSGIDERLRQIATDPAASLLRRLGAIEALSYRTGSVEVLLEWFELVRRKGGPSAGLGRRYLAIRLRDYGASEAAVEPLRARETNAIAMDSDAFARLVHGLPSIRGKAAADQVTGAP
ncbi:MAG: hypothetical protein IT204_07305 [Fimbriimonadaceae bacterium]|nr:hypothetical protein [Fimbriimonadaceae bacterium]